MVHRMAAALAATHIGQLGERIKEIHGRKIYHLASMKQPCPAPLSQNYLGEGGGKSFQRMRMRRKSAAMALCAPAAFAAR